MLVSFEKLVPLPGPVLKLVPSTYRHAYKAYPRRLASNHTLIPLGKVDIFFGFHVSNSASKCLLLRLSVYEPGLSVIEQFYSMASCSTIANCNFSKGILS
jgi:hypothetical protein